MVIIFKTNVTERKISERVIHQLLQRFPDFEINFDLEDCDKVLRIAGEDVDTEKIARMLKAWGYQCLPID